MESQQICKLVDGVALYDPKTHTILGIGRLVPENGKVSFWELKSS
jgi:hypothetical protein